MAETESYATLEDLTRAVPEWDTKWDVIASEQLEYASALLRKAFKARGFSISEQIANGELELIILKRVTINMVVRYIKTLFGNLSDDVAQYSESAGGYSVNITPRAESGDLYIRNRELEMLGLTGLIIGSISFYSFKNKEAENDTIHLDR